MRGGGQRLLVSVRAPRDRRRLVITPHPTPHNLFPLPLILNFKYRTPAIVPIALAMSPTQASLTPFITLVDGLRSQAEADGRAIKAVQAELEVVKADNVKTVDELKEEIKVVRDLVKQQAEQIDKLGDSSVSHQAQLDPLVAAHHRKRDRSTAPGPEPARTRPKLGEDGVGDSIAWEAPPHNVLQKLSTSSSPLRLQPPHPSASHSTRPTRRLPTF